MVVLRASRDLLFDPFFARLWKAWSCRFPLPGYGSAGAGSRHRRRSRGFRCCGLHAGLVGASVIVLIVLRRADSLLCVRLQPSCRSRGRGFSSRRSSRFFSRRRRLCYGRLLRRWSRRYAPRAFVGGPAPRSLVISSRRFRRCLRDPQEASGRRQCGVRLLPLLDDRENRSRSRFRSASEPAGPLGSVLQLVFNEKTVIVAMCQWCSCRRRPRWPSNSAGTSPGSAPKLYRLRATSVSGIHLLH